MATDSGPRTQDHTFSNGQQAKLRESMPMLALTRRAMADDDTDILTAMGKMEKGELDDPKLAMRLTDLMVQAMWVEPRVVLNGDAPAKGSIHIDDLDDLVVAETIDLALGEVRDAERFPGDTAGSGDGGDGKSVGKPPKRGARAGSRKRASVSD